MRFSWRTALGAVLGAALLYWVLRGTSWSDIGAALRASDVTLWALSIFVSQLIFPLRALRWRPILRPVAGRLPFGPLWRATAIFGMGTTFMGRAGDLARVYALAREEPRVPFTVGLASLVVDRTFDSIILLILLLAAMLDPQLVQGMQAQGVSVRTIVAVPAIGIPAILMVLYLAVFAPARIEAIVNRVSRAIAPRMEAKLLAIARRFIDGLAVMRNPRLLTSIFFWTLAHWLTNALAVWISMRAMNIHVPFAAALLVQGLIAMGAAAVPSPGFVGVFEGMGVFALSLYAIDSTSAKVWAITYHALSLLPITLIGLWYVARLGLSFSELRRAPEGRVAE